MAQLELACGDAWAVRSFSITQAPTNGYKFRQAGESTRRSRITIYLKLFIILLSYRVWS